MAIGGSNDAPEPGMDVPGGGADPVGGDADRLIDAACA